MMKITTTLIAVVFLLSYWHSQRAHTSPLAFSSRTWLQSQLVGSRSSLIQVLLLPKMVPFGATLGHTHLHRLSSKLDFSVPGLEALSLRTAVVINIDRQYKNTAKGRVILNKSCIHREINSHIHYLTGSHSES